MHFNVQKIIRQRLQCSLSASKMLKSFSGFFYTFSIYIKYSLQRRPFKNVTLTLPSEKFRFFFHQLNKIFKKWFSLQSPFFIR